MQETKHTCKTKNMNKTRKPTCPFFAPRTMNYTTISSSNQAAYSSSSSSSSSSSARTFTHSLKRGAHVVQPAWSMSSLMAVLPESPSPICSQASTPLATQTCHSGSETYCLENATEFSTPRNQSFRIACNDNNCFSDIDEWLEHANKFCKSSNFETNHLTESVNLRRNGSPEEDLRISAVCKDFLTAPDHELYNITLPSVREESPVNQGHSRLACINSIYGASKSGSYERRKLISRPKPYDEFLNEVRKQKQEAERHARKKAKHVELMHRMKRKEDAINDWELQQTRKAMDEMDKVQNGLERKQLMASARTQKKICLVREKAEKQKLNLRRSTMRRFQQLQISETHTPAEISWGSHIPLC